MTETNSAGVKEFIFAVLGAIGILIGYDLLDTALRLMQGGESGRNMIATIAAIAAGCVLVYFALKHYAATFTYTINKSGFCAARKSGRRMQEIEIKNKNLRSISRTPPANVTGKTCSMKKTVFSKKNTYYLTYLEDNRINTLLFEPSVRLAREIGSRIKEK